MLCHLWCQSILPPLGVIKTTPSGGGYLLTENRIMLDKTKIL